MQKQKIRGFTLMEIILVIVIFAIIAAIASTIILRGTQTYYTAQDIQEGYWQGTIAMQRFTRDINAIRSAADITTTTSNSLVFTDVYGNTITYGLSGSTITVNGSVLANGVDLANSSFTYFDNTMATTTIPSSAKFFKLQLRFTANNTLYTMVTTVQPRNVS